jgi:hypothetical protein
MKTVQELLAEARNMAYGTMAEAASLSGAIEALCQAIEQMHRPSFTPAAEALKQAYLAGAEKERERIARMFDGIGVTIYSGNVAKRIRESAP